MTVLSALQSAAVRLIGRKPTTFFSSTETFEVEMADMANEAAEDIAKSADWQALDMVATLMADGTTVAFDFPADYDRMPVHADLLDAIFTSWGYTRETDINAFLYARQSGIGVSPGIWTIYGNQFQFMPAPVAGSQVQFHYVTKNYATDAGGTPKPAFTTDNDLFRLPDRLLTLGVVWKWRQNKRLDHGEDLANFEKAINEAMGRDRGSRIFATGPARWMGDVHPSYPWSLGV